VIDSDNQVRFPNRLVINPLMGRTLRDYEWERGTQLLLGRKYAIVRSVFRRQRAVRSSDPSGTFRGIVAMGEDDFAGQTLQRTKELLAGSRVDKLSVLVRSHHAQLNELRTLAEAHKGRLEVLTEPSEIGTRLPRAHFVLTSGDGLALEMACVGVPQLIIANGERHQANAKRLDDEGAATYLGTAAKVSELTLRDAVHYLLDDPLERLGMSRCARLLIDGKGCDRIVNGLEILIHCPAERVRLRVAA
jgi:spore coat polysaccharide biosynthesis predicted glycosyltransferase SpsG